jgi:PAS domain S-box-containing protein
VIQLSKAEPLSLYPNSDEQELTGTVAPAGMADNLFANSFANAAMGMALLSAGGHVLNANAALCTLLGLGRGDIQGRHIDEFIHPEDTPDEQMARRALLSGESSSYQGERRLLHADQLDVRVHLACALMRGPGGEATGMSMQMLDISGRKAADGGRLPREVTEEAAAPGDTANAEMELRSQAAILRLNAQLEARVRQRTSQLQLANRELEAFSYSIAHDLRAPLSSIDGFSRALEEANGNSLSVPSQHYLRRIRAGVKQMAELTDGLLALSRLSQGDLLREQVDLAVLARSVVASLCEQLPSRAVDVQIQSPLAVIGDPRLLQQVMANLIGNAWKFTSHTEHARIEVGALWRKRGAAFYVRDNGAGFDLAHASRLFQAFHRMHSPSEFEGNGIGLAIVQKIVVRHGGLVWAESAPNQGATFYFTLSPDIPVGP